MFLLSDGQLHIFYKEYRYFSAEDAYAQNSDLKFFLKSNPVDWWVLLDKPEVPNFMHKGRNPGWTLVQAASPGKLKQARAWSKNFNISVYYIDTIWSIEEIYMVG